LGDQRTPRRLARDERTAMANEVKVAVKPGATKVL